MPPFGVIHVLNISGSAACAVPELSPRRGLNTRMAYAKNAPKLNFTRRPVSFLLAHAISVHGAGLLSLGTTRRFRATLLVYAPHCQGRRLYDPREVSSLPIPIAECNLTQDECFILDLNHAGLLKEQNQNIGMHGYGTDIDKRLGVDLNIRDLDFCGVWPTQ